MSRADQLHALEQIAEAIASGAPIEAWRSTALRQGIEQLRADGLELGRLRKRLQVLERRAPRRKGVRVVSADRAAVIADRAKLERRLRKAARGEAGE